ncbi:hypothetical protein KKD20_00835 [Patescibacteria group bacterium]|nr:hypothetical protein [Patescibacteria group bacterium]
MKKITTSLFIISILLVPAVSNAQQNQQGKQDQPGINEPGAGLEDSELEESGQGMGQGSQNQNEGAVSRRSRVANTAQEMERIAARNQGVGSQIRVIAQNQNRIQEEAENALQTAQKRSGFARFLIGPNYKQLKTVEERLENHTQNLAELEALKEQIQSSTDKSLIDEQIQAMEEVKQELENEITENRKGFSLFGWLSKLLAT